MQPVGLEPTTCGSVDRRSIQLSYGCSGGLYREHLIFRFLCRVSRSAHPHERLHVSFEPRFLLPVRQELEPRKHASPVVPSIFNAYSDIMRNTLFSKLSRWVFILVVGLLTSTGWSWIGTGHKVVALIAWDDLTPKTKAAITEILKQHHRYQEDLMLDAPADQTPDEQARTAFATAATWPDLVRNQDNPMHTLVQSSCMALHRHPLFRCRRARRWTEKPATVSDGPNDAVEALTKNVKRLERRFHVSTEDKAVALCWVEHIIGDLHQPLHAASLFSPEFPKGDQGGNAEVALRDPPYPDSSAKLHLIWDSLPGDFHSEAIGPSTKRPGSCGPIQNIRATR